MKKVYSKLLELGISEIESVVYLELYKHSRLDIGEFNLDSKISQAEINSAINKLLSNGFCKELPGQPGKYKAIAPSIAITTYLELQISMLQLQKKEINALLDNDKEIKHEAAMYTGNGTLVISSAEMFHKVYRSCFNSASSSIQYLSKTPVINAEQDIYEHISDIRTATRGNLSVWGIYENELKASLENRIMLETLSHLGQEIKTIDILPFDLIIFDKKIIMLRYQENESNHLLAFYSTNELVFKRFEQFYTLYWNNSQESNISENNNN